jgi:beta-glucanase (GH16 family)
VNTGPWTLAAALLALAAAPGCSEEAAPMQPYGLIWQDEFDGPAGQLPDPARWRFDLGTDWGNLQLEYDTNRPENASLDGQGNLAITARSEPYEEQAYTSARIKTMGLFEQTRGRFEARIKLPIGQGIWPAFWLLGNDIDQVGWPQCGEIDVMEYRGQEPRVLVGSIHGPGYSGNGAISQTHTLAQGGFHLGFHEFAIEWNETSITWLVDGYVYHTATVNDLPAGTAWVFNHPFFIILNVAVGGRWVGSPDASTIFPQAMLVDYVRVYGTRP